MMSSLYKPIELDYTKEKEVEIFGAKLLHHSNLSVGIDLLHYRQLPVEIPPNTFPQHLIVIFI